MTIAVVIPTLNEEATLSLTLHRNAGLGFDRMIVVDGRSTDRTGEIVEKAQKSGLQLPAHNSQYTSSLPQPSALSPQHPKPTPITLLHSAPGRARQMNLGASVSQEDVLLFLHADTYLPGEARIAIEHALAEQDCAGGRFDLRFTQDAGWSWLISRLINLRSRWSGIATGDQAIFVRRSLFQEMGGFADIPIMEDIDFTRRLKRKGRVTPIRLKVLTSFRRWETRGPVRTILLMWALRSLYWIGISPHRLARYYAMVR